MNGKPAPGQSGRAQWWAIFAILGLLLFGVPALFSIPAERILFRPEAYQQALSDQNVYQQAPRLLGGLLADSSNRIIPGSGDQLLSALSGPRYEAVMRQVFPPEWVQAQAESLVRQFWDYFNFRSPEFHLFVDMRPVKETLNGPDAPQIASAVVAGLPACDAQDLLDYTMQALTGQAQGLPLCRPPDAFLGLANQVVGGLLSGAAGLLPDQPDLAAGVSIARVLDDTSLGRTWGRSFAIYRLFRQVNPFLPLVALFFLGLLFWASYGTRRGPFFWLGLGLLLNGGAATLNAVLVQAWLPQGLPLVLGQALHRQPEIFDLLAAVLGQVTARFSGAVIISALVVAAVGFLLLGIYLYRHGKRTSLG